MMNTEYSKYVNYLFTLSSKNLENYSNNVIPTPSKIIGIKTDVLKKEAKELIKSKKMDEIIDLLVPNEYFEIDLIRGFVTAYYQGETDMKLKYLEEYIKTINNWATCDQTICATRFKKSEYSLLFSLAKKLINDYREYVCRAGLIIMLKYFVKDEYINELFDLLPKIKLNDYYVQMAIAWLLSVMYVYYPKETYQHLYDDITQIHHYSESIIIKTIQKIVDSYRITIEDKNKIKNLRLLIYSRKKEN